MYLQLKDVHVDLGGHPVLRGINVDIAEESMTAIVGPNGCGKTTLIRTIAGLLKPTRGEVLLHGSPVRAMSSQSRAQEMAILWQGSQAPGELTIHELVKCGRYAHRPWWQKGSGDDEDVVDWALQTAGVTQDPRRMIGKLSGGERQRVWLAAALAQQPRMLLLDEPTTYLDIAHQLDLLDAVSRLNEDQHITVVMVLHELSLASRFAREVVMIDDGQVAAAGTAWQVFTPDNLQAVFGIDAVVEPEPIAGTPNLISIRSHGGR